MRDIQWDKTDIGVCSKCGKDFLQTVYITKDGKERIQKSCSECFKNTDMLLPKHLR